jgi:leucyl aminopeptidase
MSRVSPGRAAVASAAAPPASTHGLDVSSASDVDAIPIYAVRPGDLKDNSAALAARTWPGAAAWAASQCWKAEAGKVLLLPGDGSSATQVGGVLLGLGERGDAEEAFQFGCLPGTLPSGKKYKLAEPGSYSRDELTRVALGWALGSYKFSRYKQKSSGKDDARSGAATLCVPPGVDAADVVRIAQGVALGRDLINTPANDCGPEELEGAVYELAAAHGARVTSFVGDVLLDSPAGSFPLIHAVGRASVRAPRLVDLVWGNPAHPRVTLVGKGVCFDTGGLDIKPPANMLAMKKDMGGAACVLALAHMVMGANLPVRLRVLVPAVENSIDGNAFRPSDVITSRKGLTVEIGNTDAEGRLVLADALALADEEQPELLIDMATLTGAHRVALGTEIPGIFTDDDDLAAAMTTASTHVFDAVWRLPLWKPYAKMLDSKVADTNSISDGAYGGAITAALFLQKFVTPATAKKGWMHVDLNAWTGQPRAGFPAGGEPQAVRALYQMLRTRYLPH